MRIKNKPKLPFKEPGTTGHDTRKTNVCPELELENKNLFALLLSAANGNPFVIQHDRNGWYVQTLIYAGEWKLVSDFEMIPERAIEQAVANLMQQKTITPPLPVAPVLTTEPEEEPSFTGSNYLDSELEEMLGQQVSAEKKSSRGSLSDYAAGKLVMKSFTGGEPEYAVEYYDSGKHKRTIAIKPETVKLVPESKDDEPEEPGKLPSTQVEHQNMEQTAASIVAEF